MINAVNKIEKFNKFGSSLGLERVRELLRRLGNPQKDLKIIHVAGTNGKGSVCRFIYNALREAGYSVGIYSSPYLEVFNERIEVDGKYIPDSALQRYTEKVSKVATEICNEGKLTPTEFDVVTCIAFMYFAEVKADFVVLEVGLGGKADSTNVIENPLITAISSISMDHMDRLGNTIEEIAAEKAGIIKEGIKVLSGVLDDDAVKVIKDKADELNAPFIDSRDFKVSIKSENLTGTVVDCEILGEKYEDFEISMIGKHQVRNAMVALGALEELRKCDIITINSEEIRRAFSNTNNPGRFEVISKDPIIVLDGAHNDDGVRSFVNTVKDDLKNRRILVVFGALKDKDVATMLNNLSELEADFIATEPSDPRKLQKEDMATKMREKGLNVICKLSPEDAVKYALANEEGYKAILFVGSLYLIGEIRRLLNVG